MGEHKHNLVATSAATRPKCGTCVHFLVDRPPHGACRAMPPTVAFGMRLGALGKPEEVVKSAWAPVQADQWCGQHPDFMRWWSEHREDFAAALALGDVTTEGRA